jgi:hypothetical protein
MDRHDKTTTLATPSVGLGAAGKQQTNPTAGQLEGNGGRIR